MQLLSEHSGSLDYLNASLLASRAGSLVAQEQEAAQQYLQQGEQLQALERELVAVVLRVLPWYTAAQFAQVLLPGTEFCRNGSCKI